MKRGRLLRFSAFYAAYWRVEKRGLTIKKSATLSLSLSLSHTGEVIVARRCEETRKSSTGSSVGWLRVTDERFSHLGANVYVPLGTVVGESLFIRVPWVNPRKVSAGASSPPLVRQTCSDMEVRGTVGGAQARDEVAVVYIGLVLCA